MQSKPPVNPPTEGVSKPQTQGPGLLSLMALTHPTTMDTDREILRLWNFVSELTEQMNQNKAVTDKLQLHAGQLQVRWYSSEFPGIPGGHSMLDADVA